MSELLYAGKTMGEIARLTPWIRQAMFLPRDKNGRLVRSGGVDDLPPWIKVDDNGMRVVGPGQRSSLEASFKRVNRELGLTDAQVDRAWQQYKDRNPKMGSGGLQGQGRKKNKRNRDAPA